ncbi:MAG: metallophosphoesterase [Lachnospiraceae bacterium]|nr:metallophosphoesterase [Lachnospiraceae bacterium]
MTAAAAVAGSACLLRSEYEKDELSVERYEIRSPKVKNAGKTFVFLTDLHDKEFGDRNRRLLAAIRGERPDAVLAGGDMVVAKGDTDLRPALSLLTTLAKEFPVFCANGNHEQRMRRVTQTYGLLYREYRLKLKAEGVVYLADSFLDFGEEFRICGMDLPALCYRKGTPKLPAGFIERTLGPAPDKQFVVLLAHSPMFFEEYAAWGADLTLAGHFHGGTIRLPFLGGVMTPQYQFFYPWCEGFFEKRGRYMLAGRGLGTHSINIRLNNKPQLIVVRVEKETRF